MYGVLFIVKTFADRAANSSLLVQCDNQSVYWIIKKGSSDVLSIHALLVELLVTAQVTTSQLSTGVDF